MTSFCDGPSLASANRPCISRQSYAGTIHTNLPMAYYYKFFNLKVDNSSHRPLLGGETLSQMINVHKALCFPVLCSLIFYAGNYTFEAILYLSMHSIYSWGWLIKSSAFPDTKFEVKLPFWLWILLQMFTTLFWVTPAKSSLQDTLSL